MKIPKILLTTLALAATTAALSAADAAANWDKSCKSCHGADGKGDTTMGKKLDIKDFTDAKVQAAFTDAQLTKSIKEGVKDADKTKMKAYTDLTDDEIKALVAKVRGFKK
jgi:mono/diheme cytochrome c family protein